MYIPVFSFSNPRKVLDFANRLYYDVRIASRHDIIFDYIKLAQLDGFQRIYDNHKGFPVEHRGHPYWRIEILRCQGVRKCQK